MKVFVHPRGVVRAVLLPAIFGWLPTLWSLFRETSFLIVAFARGLNRFAVITSFAIGSSIFPATAAPPLATYISTVSGHLGKLTFTPEEACADATAYFNPGFVYAYTAPRAQSGFWSCYWTRTQDNQTVESGFAVAQGSLCANGTIPDIKKPLALQCGGQQFWATGVATGAIREQSCSVGNPVRTGTGIKIQYENDIVSAQSDADAILRTFRSAYSLEPSDGFGSRWMHQWQRRLNGLSLQSASPTLLALRGDGRTVKFSKSGGIWTATDRSRDHVEEVMSGAARTGWKYVDADSDTTEMYDASGRLLSVTDRNGRTTTLSYSDARTLRSTAPNVGMLIAVRGWSGRTVSFVYDSARRINSITASDGSVTRYAYDANGMLANVTWPDTRVRSYHYEDSRFPWALTGITDESGVRFATYAYDAEGRATDTEHAGGVDKFQLSFLGNGQTSVTTSDATSRTFGSELQGTVLRATSVSAPCPACGDIAKAVSYDAAGNVASRRDFVDKETRYSYDALGRETQRIEGYGTADAKTTTTEWHPTWNLPVRVTRPGQINNFSYGIAGELLSYAWYTSDDPDGSKGFQAVPTGAENSTVWAYNSQGLVAKATDTLNGVAMGEWTFSYDSTGQLLSLANDYGRVGNVISRDAGGRITEAVNTDGQHLLMQYDEMGRLTSRDLNGVITTYTYNEIGLLTGVQGATNVMFEYDAAHRLTAYLLPEGQTMKASDISNPFVMASSLSSGRTAAVPQTSFWSRVWSTIKHWLGSLIGNANAQSGWTRWQVSPVGPTQSRGMPSSSSDADILEQGTGSRQWPDPGIILATWTTQVIEKGVQAAKEAICGSSEPCPPCRTVTGKIIALGTIGHRPLDTPPPGKPQHGIDGPHYNLFKANQAPRNSPKACWCFWQPIGAVRPEDLPANAIPVEHFSN